MTDHYHRRTCQSPWCDETFGVGRVIPLCYSCRYIGRVYFALGATLAGAINILVSHFYK